MGRAGWANRGRHSARTHPGSGRAGIYFETDEEIERTVFLFDTRIPDARDALLSFLPSERIASRVAETQCLIAVVFLNDLAEALRMLKELNNAPEKNG